MRALPSRPNWNHLRNQAKQVLKDHGKKDPTVCGVLRRLPRFTEATEAEILATELSLGEAQLALALEYGFGSWEALKRKVDKAGQAAPAAAVGMEGMGVRAIERGELEKVQRQCWPKRDVLEELFATQETIGFAVWENGRCVAELHGYRLEEPGKPNPRWPFWNNWYKPEQWPAEVRAKVMALPGPL